MYDSGYTEHSTKLLFHINMKFHDMILFHLTITRFEYLYVDINEAS